MIDPSSVNCIKAVAEGVQINDLQGSGYRHSSDVFKRRQDEDRPSAQKAEKPLITQRSPVVMILTFEGFLEISPILAPIR